MNKRLFHNNAQNLLFVHLEIVTSNDHKFEEIQEKLSILNLEFSHRKMSYPEIQADTIIDVCRYSLSLMIPVIGDSFVLEDSGIAIDELSGFPGPYSSFIYRTIGNEGILSLMDGKSNRNARFYSVIGLYYEGQSYLFEGICEGQIAEKPSGDFGFGFDPIFIPDGYLSTFAEIELTNR